MLAEKPGGTNGTVECFRGYLLRHHASPEALESTRQHNEAMQRLGFGRQQQLLKRLPTNAKTRKGNLAEIVLAEYVVAASRVALMVYRLRYNPNVDQSMKGDDVLAFDLDAKPVRVVVGEAKYRGTSSTAAVEEIVDGLKRSHAAGVPVSLQFVADRLFESGQAGLASRVMRCSELFAAGRLQLDYVGMLMSDTHAAERVNAATPKSLRRLAMISLGVHTPDALVADCYKDLE